MMTDFVLMYLMRVHFFPDIFNTTYSGKMKKKRMKPSGRFKSPVNERTPELVSRYEMQQLHDLLFRNSNFALFLTSLYRLLVTAILLSVAVCWLLACKYLIMLMASRSLAMLTSKVILFIAVVHALNAFTFKLEETRYSHKPLPYYSA